MAQSKRTPRSAEVLRELLNKQPAAELKLGDVKVRIYLVEVDAAMATKVLESCNPHNRKLRQNKLAGYAALIKRGDWLAQCPLMFDDSGILIDGQHRLKAVVQAERSEIFLVQVVPMAERFVRNENMDTTIVRNLADFLHFNGVANAYRAAPVLAMERNWRVTGDPFQAMQGEKKDYLNLAHEIGEEPLKAAFDCVPRGMANQLEVKAAALDWLSLHLAQVDPEHARVFFGTTLNPSQLRETDAPWQLNQRLVAMVRQRDGGRKFSAREQGTALVKAWNHYFENKPTKPTDLKMRPQEEFPTIAGEQ